MDQEKNQIRLLGVNIKKNFLLGVIILIVLILCVVIAISPIVMTAIWQLSIFNLGQSTTQPEISSPKNPDDIVWYADAVSAKGFSRVKPQLAYTLLRTDGSFETVLTNGVGTTILINEGEIVIKVDDKPCENLKIDKNELDAGENVEISSHGCSINRESKKVTVEVMIPYTYLIEGDTYSKIESGQISLTS